MTSTPSTRRRLSGASATIVLLAGLALAVGCDSAPKASDQPPPTTATEAPRDGSTAAMRSTMTPPALTRVESNDGRFLVIYRTRPEPIPVGDRFTIEATVHDIRRGDVALRDVELVVDAAMPHHRHGMNVVPTVRKQNDGSFVASGMLFHMPGRWEIYFDITRGLVTERAQCEVWLE